MNRPWIKLSIAVSFILLMTAILNFPASLALGWAQQRYAIPIGWQQVNGSIFKFEIYGLKMAFKTSEDLYLDHVTVKSLPMSLLSGELESYFKLNYSNQELTGNSILDLNRWHIENIIGSLTIRTLYPQFPELEMFGVAGHVEFALKQLSGRYYGLPDQGNVEIRINEVETEVVKIDNPLGNYLINIDNISTDKISGRISNLPGNNQLLINSLVSFEKDNKILQVSGQAWLSERADPLLSELLLLLGQYDNKRVLIDWKSNLM